jgi:hypothetical protein
MLSPSKSKICVPCALADLLNYVRLMKECWQQDLEKRPGFGYIAARLMAMVRWRLLANNLKQYGVSALLGVAQDVDDQHQVRPMAARCRWP